MTAKKEKRSLINSVVWSGVEIFIKRGLDLVVRLILARLLLPEDFGLVGMAVVFTTFIQVLNDGGMGLALIQKKTETIKEAHFHTVFWAAMGWTALLYVLIYFVISPFVAWFYEEPMLESIVNVLSLSLFFNSLNTVHKAQLYKGMLFKKIAFVHNISSVFAGVVAVVMALFNFGVWALVAYTTLSFFVAIPLYFRATGWLPKVVWDKQAFREIFGFGVYTTTTKAVNNLSGNVDYLVIGKLVSAAALGAYALAFMLTSMVKAQLQTMINRVLFPFYSSIQDDLVKLKTYYLKTLRYYGIVIFPLMGVLIVFGGKLVPWLFGNKWTETVLPMKILAFAAAMDVATSGYNLLFRSVGKPKTETKMQLFTVLVFLIPAVLIGVYYNGVVGVAYGILVSAILKTLYVQYFLKKEFTIYPLDVFAALQKPFIVTLALAIGSYFLNRVWAYPLIWMMLFGIVYVILIAWLHKEELVMLVKNKKKL